MTEDLRQRCAAALPGARWDCAAPRDLPVLAPPGLPLETLRRAVRRAARPLLLVNDSARVALAEQATVLADLWEQAHEPPILVATGTHAEDLARMRDRLGGLPCALHHADEAADHGPCGPGALDRRVLAADLVVAFGSVEPHYFAGWAGAHKTATVGVADRATIARNHAQALETGARPLGLEGNPVFEGLAALLAALERDRRLLAVNHVLDPRGRPLAVGVGTWRGALRRVLAAAEQRFLAPLDGPRDLLVVQPEGPLGTSLYQADKAIKNHEAAVRSGGTLVLWAPELSGAGPDRFLTLLRAAPDLTSARAEVERAGYVLGDHKAVRLRALEARGVRILVAAPRLDPAALAGTGFPHFMSLEDALAEAAGQRPEQALAVSDAGVLVSALRPPGASRAAGACAP